jgi:predicted O-methyltransferase YrrM
MRDASAAISVRRFQALEHLFAGADRNPLNFAEIGAWKGATTVQLAKFLGNQGTLHIFDYEDTAAALKANLLHAGFTNVKAWGNSYRYLDSYNWNLRLILENHPGLQFDYIYIDGAHTWAIDALAFLLCDILLKPGGYIHFDNHGWRLRGSSLDPRYVPETAQLYTDPQIDDLQVKAIVDLLVRPRGAYMEIVKDVLFQKIGGDKTHRYRTSSSEARREMPAPQPTSRLALDAPHLFEGEFEVMRRIMQSGRRRYQEFGIGGSTLMAVRSEFESIVSVDSDPNWIAAARENQEISEAIRAGRADIRHADIGPVAMWGHPSDLRHMRIWPAYVATAWEAWEERGAIPDLIFIDGRFRVACCLSAILLSDPGSRCSQEPLVMLHDVCPDRPYYNAVFEFFDIVESVNTLRVLRIKPGVSRGRVMSQLLRHQLDPR